MRLKVSIVLSVLASVCVVPAHALTYYVAANGNDNANGLTPLTAWQSIQKVSAAARSGDTVLFRRGDVFRGQVEVPAANITFDAFGLGANPVISGSVVVSGWTQHSGNIYRAQVSQPIKHLYVNGELQTIARYPNNGWLRTGTGHADTGFTDPALTSHPRNAAGYWNGATVRIRTYSWLLDIRKVQSYDANGRITFDRVLTETVRPSWGYYLDGKLEELDVAGEWFYDAAGQRVYLYAPGGVNPSTLLVEGMTYDFGFHVFWQKHNVNIQHLTMRHQADDGINMNQSNGVTVRNCRFEDINGTAVQMSWNARDVHIDNNEIEDVLNVGISWNTEEGFNVGNSTISGNALRNIAMRPGYGGSGQQSMGIHVTAEGVKVLNNRVEDVGYNGIFVQRGGNTIEGNYVSGACKVLNDGGALWLSSGGNVVRNNFFLNTLGNLESSGTFNGLNLPRIAVGIYFHQEVGNNVIENNTVAYNSHNGIYVDGGTGNVIRRNICYGNGLHQLHLRGDDSTPLNTTVENNILFSTEAKQAPLYLAGLNSFGTFTGNFYYNPFDAQVVKTAKANDLGVTWYTFARWRAAFPGRDATGGTWNELFDEFQTTDTGGNLVENPSFTSTIHPWHFWQSTIAHDTTSAGLDGGALRVQWQTAEAQTWPSGLSLQGGQWYALRFSARGQGHGQVRVQIYDETVTPSWVILGIKYFPLSAARGEYEWVFRAPYDVAQSRPWFFTTQNESTWWLDNVTVTPVDALRVSVEDKFRLVMNPGLLPATIPLLGNVYRDLQGVVRAGSILLPPLSSIILVNDGPATVEGEPDGDGEEGEGNPGAEPDMADVSGNFKYEIREVLRVVQLFNSGSFHCDVAGEDGYNPLPGDTSCAPYSRDYKEQDWRISLSEVLRVVQIFNANGYYRCDLGEDGLCLNE